MGVVYHANYLVWFEVARADYLRATGWTYRELEETGVFLPVIEARCEYKRPARYDEEIEIRTMGRLASAVRMEFNYDVVIRQSNQLAATGSTVHAATDSNGRPCRLPDRIREMFA